jgi:hypothetical protein
MGFLIIAFSCAKINSPSGGPRDRNAPVVLESAPANGAKNFKGNKLTISFDEYIVLDNINEKFIVSPPMEKKPDVFIRGKNIVVEFKEKLRDSTTYTFYFQDAIKDVNEGNILSNYKFVLSTGQVIDSLSVTGRVLNANDLEIPEKTIVLMYSKLDDSAVLKHIPDYISQVDKEGYFRIDNVREGTYRLYALEDQDNSKNFNSLDEKFAFFASPVNITVKENYLPVNKKADTLKVKVPATNAPDSKGTVKTKIEPVISNADSLKRDSEFKLYIFASQKKNYYLSSSGRQLKYLMTFVLSLPPENMLFDVSIPDAGEDMYFTERSRYKDTLNVWITDSTVYSKTTIPTIIRYPFTDSLGINGYKTDTVSMRYSAPRAPRVATVKKPVLSVNTNISNGFLKPGNNILLSSLTPLKKPDTAQIHIYEILESGKKVVGYELTNDIQNSQRYTLKTNLIPGKKYLLVADSSSFRDVFNECSDSMGINFMVKASDDYCKLTLNVSNYDGGRIIQILDKAEKLIYEKYMERDGKIEFPLLDNGSYRMKVIYDLDGNRKWTTGDFSLNRQPEPVSYYPGELDLKSGWEIEQDWDIGLKNEKLEKLIKKKTGN